jgi:hypothetical protein
MKRLSLMLLPCALASAGCPSPSEPAPAYSYEPDVALQRITDPPPSLVGEIVNEPDTREIVLSLGVSLAARCWDFCELSDGRWGSSNCEDLTFTVDDEPMLSVHEALLPGEPDTYVLVAGASGDTTLHVETTCGVQDYRVVVE